MRIDEAAVQRNQEASAIKLGFGLSSKALWFGEIALERVSVFLWKQHAIVPGGSAAQSYLPGLWLIEPRFRWCVH
jgi:hypothetical protein